MQKLTSIVLSTVIAVSTYIPLLAHAEGIVSLEDAINIARKKVTGDLISIDVDFDDKDNQKYKDKYELTFIGNNIVYKVEVDAQFGNIEDIDESDLEDDDRSTYKAFKKYPISLNRAIEAATQRINGEVIEAEFDVKNGKPFYDIHILKEKKKYKLKVSTN